jgi:hypothetical protein
MNDLKVGMILTHEWLGMIKVIAVHALGTIDVERMETGRCYRISGLSLN